MFAPDPGVASGELLSHVRIRTGVAVLAGAGGSHGDGHGGDEGDGHGNDHDDGDDDDDDVGAHFSARWS